jgi:hypothetical protein
VFPKCKTSRYHSNVKVKNVEQKVLIQFPIIPILKHMFHCKYLAEYMDQHIINRRGQDMLHILTNSKAMNHIENT